LLAKNDIKNITGVEVQESVAEMASRSIELNKLQNKFNIINCNVKDILHNVQRESFDVVVTNPPYKKVNTGGKNEDEGKLISRHEVLADVNDFIEASKKVLKDKGAIYIVHRPERIADIICALRKNKLEPKKIQFVYSKKESSEAKLVLIKAIKNGGQFLKIEKPLYIYEDDGSYTKEVLKIYNKEGEEDE
jgi:tRNA1Val (adenine37-N6)-methyltransferase